MKGCLKESAGDGIDCYFDNVGGSLSATVRSFMRYPERIKFPSLSYLLIEIYLYLIDPYWAVNRSFISELLPNESEPSMSSPFLGFVIV